MAIKDQCEICRHSDGCNCLQLEPSFDGSSCDAFNQRINLAKAGNRRPSSDPDPQPDFIPQYNVDTELDPDAQSSEKIHGWLLFFLICYVGIGMLAMLINDIIDLGDSNEMTWVAALALSFLFTIAAAGIMTLEAFNHRDTDAVFLAKTYVVLCVVANIIGILGIDQATEPKEIIGLMRGVFIGVIWFLFLCCSKQVKRLIPKENRRTKTRDWILIAAAVLLPFICFGFVFDEIRKSQAESEATALANLTLADNQYSDGRILLTVPDGFYCQTDSSDELMIFNITDPATDIEVNVMSDYDDDNTQRNFDNYWEVFRSAQSNDYSYEINGEKSFEHHGSTVFYRNVVFDTPIPLYWEFVLMFDKSGKVCLITSYSPSDLVSPVSKIINNIRFL